MLWTWPWKKKKKDGRKPGTLHVMALVDWIGHQRFTLHKQIPRFAYSLKIGIARPKKWPRSRRASSHVKILVHLQYYYGHSTGDTVHSSTGSTPQGCQINQPTSNIARPTNDNNNDPVDEDPPKDWNFAKQKMSAVNYHGEGDMRRSDPICVMDVSGRHVGRIRPVDVYS